jgi:hypothetical protein
MAILSGLGVGLVRDSSTLMVAQYFKRKRELVEVIVVSGEASKTVFHTNKMDLFIHKP